MMGEYFKQKSDQIDFYKGPQVGKDVLGKGEPAGHVYAWFLAVGDGGGATHSGQMAQRHTAL